VIFADKKQRARAHLQCVPKRHIKDWTCLQVQDIPLLTHMHEVALTYVNEKYPGADGFVFGFHSPGSNSKFHLHMHCVVLPLSSLKY
jgi:diadenosine tetraphosphate (Ap4A) HIT family hydrolase